jgi:hypothetical protein
VHSWRDVRLKARRGIDGIKVLSVGGILEHVEVAEIGFRVEKVVHELLEEAEIGFRV